MVHCLSYYILFHVGEKGPVRNSIVFLKDLPTPTCTVLKWPKVSPVIPGMKKNQLVSQELMLRFTLGLWA